MPRFQPNESFWHDAIPVAPPRPLRGARRADVVVVGGGYAGLSCALALKRRAPATRVVVLEAHHVGFGSSGRNAGMVLHGLHPERARRFGRDAVRFTYEQVVGAVDTIARWSREYGFDCELERDGYLDVALHPAHLRRLAAKARVYRDYGQDYDLLDARAVQNEIRVPDFLGAGLYPHAAQLHPGKYVVGLKAAALREGVELYEGTPVLGLDPGPSVRARTPEGHVEAGAAVLALNAYHPASGLPRGNRAVSLFSFIVLTEPLGARLAETLGWERGCGYSDLRRLHNYVRRVGDRLLFGGRVRYRFGTALSAAQARQMYGWLEQELRARFPMLGGVRVSHRWCGSVAFNLAQYPTLGALGRHGNVFYSLGYSGLGVSLATLAGRVLADLCLGRGDRWDGLIYLRDKQFPLPPEPFRFLGFTGKYWWMRFLDWRDRRGR